MDAGGEGERGGGREERQGGTEEKLGVYNIIKYETNSKQFN